MLTGQRRIGTSQPGVSARRKEGLVTTAENEAIIRGWFQAFNDRDWPAEAAVHAADFVAHVPGAPPLDN